MALALHECHDGLALAHTLIQGVFLDFLTCHDLEGLVHDTLPLTEHYYLIDHLGVGTPILGQVQLLPLEVVQFSLLISDKRREIDRYA